MGRIFYIMGKSSSGKDTIFEELKNRQDLNLHQIILYTTRPIRAKETDGVEYHFTDEAGLAHWIAQGKVIELREYHTVHGIWKYFTVDDDQIRLDSGNYLAIGVPESYQKVRAYFGTEKVVPIYIEVEDGVRLERAMKRERKQAVPSYEEMCRRFLADQADFSEENLQKAGITKRFANNGNRLECMAEVADYISGFMGES
ncbi:MAG: guanylate kinase [Lachnospiraceae bacterium]|nr:guanylate kinase [Lachnospiraceae bacterium]MDD3794912.1 guanylate kinase [Lachnospiraceae bacterium]